MQHVLENAVAEGDVPFVVAMAGNAAGTTFSGAAGEAAPGRAAAENAVFAAFSMTKAVGSLAAMILADCGEISLDTPVDAILPEWNDLRVLDGFDGETPVLRKPGTRALVRHLMTHTSGLEYDFLNRDLKRALKTLGIPNVMTGQRAGLFYPLVADPGDRWAYGLSTDWLGLLVEAADGRSIDRFCHDEIFTPLGLEDTRFEPEGLEDRLCSLSARTEDGGFAPSRMAPPSRPEFYGMGHALYTTAPDYLRFLRMILNGGALDGSRILSEETARTMLEDQMQGLTFQKMESVAPHISASVDYPGKRMTHSAIALRNEEDWPGRRSAGSQGWAGVCNTHFWLDPSRDVAAVFMTQCLPFADPRVLGAYGRFEKAVYDTL